MWFHCNNMRFKQPRLYKMMYQKRFNNISQIPELFPINDSTKAIFSFNSFICQSMRPKYY